MTKLFLICTGYRQNWWFSTNATLISRHPTCQIFSMQLATTWNSTYGHSPAILTSPHTWPLIPKPILGEWQAWQRALQTTLSLGKQLTLPLPWESGSIPTHLERDVTTIKMKLPFTRNPNQVDNAMAHVWDITHFNIPSNSKKAGPLTDWQGKILQLEFEKPGSSMCMWQAWQNRL